MCINVQIIGLFLPSQLQTARKVGWWPSSSWLLEVGYSAALGVGEAVANCNGCDAVKQL